MSWAGHDDAPHFQISSDGNPRLKGMIDALATLAGQNRRAVAIVLSAAVIAGTIALGPKIKNSVTRTLERIGQSTEFQGRAFTGITQSPVEKSRSGNSVRGKVD